MTCRITVSPEQMGGAPCIRGLRIPVSVVADMLTTMTHEEILALYPDLEKEDLDEVALISGRA